MYDRFYGKKVFPYSFFVLVISFLILMSQSVLANSHSQTITNLKKEYGRLLNEQHTDLLQFVFAAKPQNI